MNLEQYMLPCLSKSLFGIECLGCGFQRGLLLLLQGDFIAAFKMYPALYSTLIFMSILALNTFDKKGNYKKAIMTSAITNGVFMVVGYYFKHY